MTELRYKTMKKSLAYWHKQVREYGRRGDRYGVQRAVAAVHKLQKRLYPCDPLSYV